MNFVPLSSTVRKSQVEFESYYFCRITVLAARAASYSRVEERKKKSRELKVTRCVDAKLLMNSDCLHEFSTLSVGLHSKVSWNRLFFFFLIINSFLLDLVVSIRFFHIHPIVSERILCVFHQLSLLAYGCGLLSIASSHFRWKFPASDLNCVLDEDLPK